MKRDDIIEKWRLNKGIGTIYYSDTDDYLYIVSTIISNMFNRCDTPMLVVVPKFDDRIALIDAVRDKLNDDRKELFNHAISTKRFLVYTNAFLAGYRGDIIKGAVFAINPDSISPQLAECMSKATFRFTILSSFNLSVEDKDRLYKHCPMLVSVLGNNIEDKLSSPVEEMWVPVDINLAETKAELDKCNEYINRSMAIFGSFDMIAQARIGNPSLNISAASICQRIAEDHGWSDHLDMSNDINKQIDELFNPIAIKDRATITYDVIRSRSNILTDYSEKLDAILDIVKNEIAEEHKVLIISKRGEFAKQITDFINNDACVHICGDYHDKLDPIPAIDDKGKPILYKSGANKGKIRMYGAQAQKTRNVRYFNEDRLFVLSTNASPDKTLECKVDTIVITSPLCDTLEEYIYRLDKLGFKSDKIKLYTIYCKDTMESKALERRNTPSTHNIVNKSEFIANYDENLGAVFVE